ncbi:hypothetical protein AX16_003366 [Volvariella volvacea WC 439]|nr:hypothetical protein AX16_003366 [Volvariella volvacea WC 439]
MPFSKRYWKWAAYSLICILADTLDAILSAIPWDERSQPEAGHLLVDIEGLSDKEIIKLLPNSPKVHPDYFVRHLTLNTVVKTAEDLDEGVSESEADVLDLLHARTRTLVPRVRRVLKDKHRHVIVMDYINGQSLAELWPVMTIWKKIYVAFTLRRYIRQLRTLEAPLGTPPGPLSAYDQPRNCLSPIFGAVQPKRGPFKSYVDLST